MIYSALRMLLGDSFKFFALVFTIASVAFLISQQVGIFTGLMVRTTSQIRDVGASVWAMDPSVQYVDELRTLPDGVVDRVRSISSIASAHGLHKGFTRAIAGSNFRQSIIMGLDDHTLAGAPKWMLLGSAQDLNQPDAIIIDDRGYESLFPGQELRLGDSLELNERRATIVGICRVSPPFATFPVLYARQQTARNFVGRERNFLTFVIAEPREGVPIAKACADIERATGLRAMGWREFAWKTVWFYVNNTGIPVNFAITITVASVVGVVITAQTFLVFIIENTRNFAAMKAMGAGQWLLTKMIGAQVLLVGTLGLGIGLGVSALFFWSTKDTPKLRDFQLYMEILAGTSLAVIGISLLAAYLGARHTNAIQPAVVFRG